MTKKTKTSEMVTLVVSNNKAEKKVNPESPISFNQMRRGSFMLKKATGISLFGVKFNEHFGKRGIYDKIFAENGVQTQYLNIVTE